MTINVKTDNGFAIVEESAIRTIEYHRDRASEEAFVLVCDNCKYAVSIKDVSSFADLGIAIAMQAIAAYVADRMINGEPKSKEELEREKNERALREIHEMMKQYKSPIKYWPSAVGTSGEWDTNTMGPQPVSATDPLDEKWYMIGLEKLFKGKSGGR